MSTDIETSMPAEVAQQAPTVFHGGGLDMIAQTAGQLGQAYQIAEALCGTQFAPQHFRGKPQEAAAAILFGAQVGLDPLASMQNIYVIGGKPALYARTMAAIVQAAGHAIWTEESTDDAVTVVGQRRGSEAIERITWTMERAQKAGYTSNKNYQKDPQAMLYARAVGDVARRIAPDALLGMSYTVEEMRVSTAAEESQRSTQARPSRRQSQQQAPIQQQAASGRDWIGELQQCETAQQVRGLWKAAHEAGELSPELREQIDEAGRVLAQSETAEAETMEGN